MNNKSRQKMATNSIAFDCPRCDNVDSKFYIMRANFDTQFKYIRANNIKIFYTADDLKRYDFRILCKCIDCKQLFGLLIMQIGEYIYFNLFCFFIRI